MSTLRYSPFPIRHVVRMGLVGLLGAWLLGAGGNPTVGAAGPGEEARGGLPLMFVENVGQWEGRGRFQVPGADRAIWLAEDGIWVTVVAWGADPSDGRDEAGRSRGVALRLSFVGANPHARLEPLGRMETSVNYLIGNDPTRWRRNVPVWRGVRYRGLYPGVDLEVRGEGGRWKWRLVCRGGDCGKRLKSVGLRVEGAEVEAVGREGVRLATGVGTFTVPLLEAAGAQEPPAPRRQGDGVVMTPFVSRGFGREAAGDVQPASGSLLYATFLGGSSHDYSYGLAVDGVGAAYVTGLTVSPDFPTTPGAYDTTFNGLTDVFVAKLNPAGQGNADLAYATFLGGIGVDQGWGIAVDGVGAAYVVGYTESSDFPTTPGAYDTSHNGGGDVFVVKLNASGSGLAYATFLGGALYDEGRSLAVDGNGAAYVTGLTGSSGFPTTPGAYDTSHNGNMDVFVVKLNPAGQGNADLAYATFLGGSSWDEGWGIAVDGVGAAYVTGLTGSSDFPTTPGAYDTSPNGGDDVFVVKLNPAGQGNADLAYATFLGGSSGDEGLGLAVDGSGAAYVTGLTGSSDFPTTPGAYDTTFNGLTDVFVVKLNPAGQGNADLAYATFLGGSSGDEGHGIAVDGNGAAYVTGLTGSSGFPTTPGAYDTTFNGLTDVFVVKLNPAGQGNADLAYATFLGGGANDQGYGIAVDGNGAAYVTGPTGSSDFPTTPGAYDTSPNGSWDAFVVKLSTLPTLLAPVGLAVDPNGNEVWDSGETATVVPTWQNNEAAAVSATGTAGNVVVPPDVTASLTDTTADYGTVAAGASANCQTATGNCYAVTGSRTAWGHRDVTIDETLTAVWALQQPAPKTWTLHIGPSFADVAPNVFYYKAVETLLHRGVTGGCTASDYCPLQTVNRAQMAIFISRAVLGTDPPASGSGPGGSWDCTDNAPNHFTDVPDGAPYCRHVHWMWANNIAGGCTATTYCPLDPVNRAQMAIFISRAVLGMDPPPSGSGPGGSWDCTDSAPNHFTDVPDGAPYCRHVHWMWANNITGGCTATTYCPLDPVNRAQMAVFLVRAFNLLLYGP
ncbi:hypothetical protein HRbin11_01483 [bacterium HR11]|nr:hypothetical protein HRbin11_01483 [bacterium HR11]